MQNPYLVCKNPEQIPKLKEGVNKDALQMNNKVSTHTNN